SGLDTARSGPRDHDRAGDLLLRVRAPGRTGLATGVVARDDFRRRDETARPFGPASPGAARRCGRFQAPRRHRRATARKERQALSGERFASALRWNFAFSIATVILQVGVTSVVARLLSPTDFGVYAIANIAVIFGRHFGDRGLLSAIVREREL